jgi:hypothetical protein
MLLDYVRSQPLCTEVTSKGGRDKDVSNFACVAFAWHGRDSGGAGSTWGMGAWGWGSQRRPTGATSRGARGHGGNNEKGKKPRTHTTHKRHTRAHATPEGRAAPTPRLLLSLLLGARAPAARRATGRRLRCGGVARAGRRRRRRRRTSHISRTLLYSCILLGKAKNSFLATRQHGVVGSRRGCRRRLFHGPAVAQAASPGPGRGRRGEPDLRSPGPDVQPLQHEHQHTLCCRLPESAQRNRGACPLYLSIPLPRLLC